MDAYGIYSARRLALTRFAFYILHRVSLTSKAHSKVFTDQNTPPRFTFYIPRDILVKNVCPSFCFTFYTRPSFNSSPRSTFYVLHFTFLTRFRGAFSKCVFSPIGEKLIVIGNRLLPLVAQQYPVRRNMGLEPMHISS